MTRALKLLLTGFLLQGALCGQFKVSMPKTINVLSGSCVTIPCSFDIKDDHEKYLDNTCRAIWRNDGKNIFDSSSPQNGQFTGNLRLKDCSTTLNNKHIRNNNEYKFRLECNNALQWGYENKKLTIHVTDNPPTPTLTPSTLKVKEGSSVSLRCSAPAPCLSHPPNLTWTPGLGDSVETLLENQDKTKVQTSVLNFTASHLHHGKEISCTAAYRKQNGRTRTSVSRITADISFPPKILPSSDCAKHTGHINCSCETVGNPSPTLHWYLDGLPVNHSDKFTISSQSMNGTSLRSIMIVDQPHRKDCLTVVCRSTNSRGSASQKFCVHVAEHQPSQGPWMLPVFIPTIVALLLVVCYLLWVIRAQKTRHNPPNSQCKGNTSTVAMNQLPTSDTSTVAMNQLPTSDTSTVAMNQLPTSATSTVAMNQLPTSDTSTVAMNQLPTNGERDEIPNTAEEDIYANNSVMRQANTTISETNTNSPRSEPENAEGDGQSSKEKEEGSDVIYSSVIWKSKKKKNGKDSGDMDQSGSSYLEEERCMVGATCRNFLSDAVQMESLYDEPTLVKKEVECEYAQVQFKDKNTMRK